MIPDVAFVTFAFSMLIMMARFARLAKAFMMQLVGKNLIGSLRNGHASTKPPQALPAAE